MIFNTRYITQRKFEYAQTNNPLLLVAYNGNDPIGFKLGYEIPATKTFFSWLGGVHSDHRRQGIANSLLALQEESVRDAGLEKIYFTTFDRFPEMINLGKKNLYQLNKSELDDGEMKYWYEKRL